LGADGVSSRVSSTAIQSAYGRWARAYDALAVHAPGVSALRGRAADALSLSPGDTVVDLGCGTGANFPTLRSRVGPDGHVVGVDLTAGMLTRARDRARRWDNVAVCRGDAASPPLSPDGDVDAVLATFLVGMLDAPADAVRTWLDVVGDGGRVALLDGEPSPRAAAAPLNLAFRAFVRLGAPGNRWAVASPAATLARRVEAAHGELAERSGASVERRALGFVRLTAASP
jgi:ubiquinone/menaquinone biosynthesis C-methylase UbiE